MVEEVLKGLNIPVDCEVNNTIYKKLFYDNASMNSSDKDIFSRYIDKIIWLYSFKEDTINIKALVDDVREYDEIAVIKIILKENSKFKRIAEIVQRTIPYPMVLIFNHNNKVLFNVAHKRKNKADESKNLVEELIYTGWIDISNLSEKDKCFLKNLNIKEFNTTDIYRFYCSFVDRVNIFNANKYMESNKEIKIKDAEMVKALTDKIEELEERISDLRRGLRKEVHFNRKVEMNVELNKLVSRKKELIEKLTNY